MATGNELRAVIGKAAPGPGHGECFVWTRGKKTVVVDSGGAKAVGADAASHKPEILILSHDDKDHIGGAASLIGRSAGSIKQLWVPAEWAILLDQISRTPVIALAQDVEGVTVVDDVAKDLAAQLAELEGSGNGGALHASTVARARLNLDTWTANGQNPHLGFKMRMEQGKRAHFYGAAKWDEIIKRVRKRAVPLTDIFRSAFSQSIEVHFFSIDLALGGSSRSERWTKSDAGVPGLVTFANAVRAPHAPSVRIPPGIAHAYALSRLTVQNRRALSTLLWANESDLANAVLVWSDTDGQWLTNPRLREFDRVIPLLSGSSAPHHASGNPAHDEVWRILRGVAGDVVMISAGGQHNQQVRREYNLLKTPRGCTWCRGKSSAYQEVYASAPAGARLHLMTPCLVSH